MKNQTTLNNLIALVKNKQLMLEQELYKLNQEREGILQIIDELSSKYLKKQIILKDFKQSVYQQISTKVSINEIQQMHSKIDRRKIKLKEILSSQEQKELELKQLQQEILKLQQNLKQHIVKIEKYLALIAMETT